MANKESLRAQGLWDELNDCPIATHLLPPPMTMQASDAVERAARAIQQAHHESGRGIAPPFDLLDKFEAERWRIVARAAIAAMPETATLLAAIEAKDATITALVDALERARDMLGTERRSVVYDYIDAILAKVRSQ